MTRIRIVMVRTSHPGNVGAAARAMANFGLEDMWCVAPQCNPRCADARQRAVRGAPILDNVQVVDDLAEALADCHTTIATTRRTGQNRQHVRCVTDLADMCSAQPSDAQIAIVFGSEEHGLHNPEIAQCQQGIAIPTQDACPSLNLAQAVGIVAYELQRGTCSVPAHVPVLAEHGQLEGFFVQLEAALGGIGFFPHGEPFHVMRQVRRALYRAEMTETEVALFRGIAQQIAWAGQHVAGALDTDNHKGDVCSKES